MSILYTNDDRTAGNRAYNMIEAADAYNYGLLGEGSTTTNFLSVPAKDISFRNAKLEVLW